MNAIITAIVSVLGEILLGWINKRLDAQAAADKATADQSTETKTVIQETANAQAQNNARVRSAHDVAEWLRQQK